MKDTRADAKLKNLSEEALETLWVLRNPSDDGEKMKLEDVRVYCQNELGISVSLSTLHEFYAWLSLKKRMEAAQARAEQTRLELLKDCRIEARDVERVAQAVFTAEALDSGNVAAYVAVTKLQLQARQIELEREKLTSAARSKIEAGLDALFAEIKGNLKAEKLFAELQAAVAKA